MPSELNSITQKTTDTDFSEPLKVILKKLRYFKTLQYNSRIAVSDYITKINVESRLM